MALLSGRSGSGPTTPSRANSGSRPQTPGPQTPHTPHTPAGSSYSSYSAFSSSPSIKLPPVHLSTTGRGELLRWLNDVLDTDLKDISEANNGAVACQIMDRLNPYNPDVINMRRVDFNARDSYYKAKNWRILQLAFVELEISWNVDVERCQKGHQMDLLLLFRLLKQRFDTWEAELRATGQELPPYDAKARRAMSKTGDFRDPLSPSPSLPHASPSSKRRLAYVNGNGIAGGDGDSALEYGVKQRQVASTGTQMGASFKKQQGKQSIWQKFKLAVKSK